MNDQAPSIWMPALIGGAVFGVLGGLPIVGALNCLCCSLIMGAGFLAAFLYSKECAKTGTEFRPGGGAKVGVVAGLFYAVVTSIVAAGVGVLMADYNARQLDRAIAQIESNQEIPPEIADMMITFAETMSGGASLILVGVAVVTGLIFGTIGGLIGGAVFKVEAAPPPAPSQPPV
jgi:hypothetical protein